MPDNKHRHEPQVSGEAGAGEAVLRNPAIAIDAPT